jgi:hypothetical protein
MGISGVLLAIDDVCVPLERCSIAIEPFSAAARFGALDRIRDLFDGDRRREMSRHGLGLTTPGS